MKALLFALALLPECPYFYEFLPHPVDVPDREGEYLVVKWESSVTPWDTIYLQMDNNKVFSVYVPPDSFFTELLLHRGAPGACPVKNGLLCLPLTSSLLPNTRATVWNLSAGMCRDTAYLPVPKPGMLIRKDTTSGQWILTSKTLDNALSLDSLISFYGEIPLYISEVAPCPQEGIPEWFEVTNRTVLSFPLDGISDCKRAPIKTTDSIKGRSSILITKDSTDLRAFLQTGEIPIYQIPIATLRNSSDTLRLCYNGIKLDSVMWGKAVNRPIKCPSTESISPGFVPRVSNQKVLQLSERILVRSKKGSMLRVRINSEIPVELRLIDRAGVGIVRKTIGVQDLNSSWITIPEWRRCQNGPCFIILQGEGINETAAFIVRP
ncbi:MAG: hypothetical protein LBU89_08050 [Fibromonadaceae bacterium]|jgi:hypothetical protein|nr:hypothetical protein [Fibromonadaceae bacterium]